MINTEEQQWFEKVRLAHHHFERMKSRLDLARAAARDTRVPADRDARLRAEKEFKMALDNLIFSVAQSVEHLPKPVRSKETQRTTKGGGRRRS